MKILISGVTGFIASHLVKYLSKKHQIYGLYRNTKDMYRIEGMEMLLMCHDLRDKIIDPDFLSLKPDVIIHMAAMSHVDRSIKDPYGAVMDNVVGTYNILEYARVVKPKLFIYFSTDEVFGPNKGKQKFKEWDRFNPGNPYSATKAGGEDLALSYHNTYGVPVIITHCMNVMGTHQNVEKFIPKAVKTIKEEWILPIYADSTKQKSGTRNYIHTNDVNSAIEFIIKNGKIGDKYNISGSKEISNIKIARTVANTLGKNMMFEYVASDDVRPGNDFSYGIDGSKLKKMGWEPKEDINKRLIEVIKWYDKNI